MSAIDAQNRNKYVKTLNPRQKRQRKQNIMFEMNEQERKEKFTPGP